MKTSQLKWKIFSPRWAKGHPRLTDIINALGGQVSWQEAVEQFFLTAYRLKLAPFLYEKHSHPVWDVYLYFLWTFGMTPNEVDELPAEFVSYVLAKKLQRGW